MTSWAGAAKVENKKKIRKNDNIFLISKHENILKNKIIAHKNNYKHIGKNKKN